YVLGLPYNLKIFSFEFWTFEQVTSVITVVHEQPHGSQLNGRISCSGPRPHEHLLHVSHRPNHVLPHATNAQVPHDLRGAPQSVMLIDVIVVIDKVFDLLMKSRQGPDRPAARIQVTTHRAALLKLL